MTSLVKNEPDLAPLC